MKKLILTLAAVSALTFAGFSQDNSKMHANQTNTMSINDRAEIESGKIAKELLLDESKRAQIKQFTLTRINANMPLREKAKATTDKAAKKALHQQIKANGQTFYNNVNGILTPAQQTEWARIWKERQEKKEHHEHD